MKLALLLSVLVLSALAVSALPQEKTGQLSHHSAEEKKPLDCLSCVKDIINAYISCQGEDVDILTCITTAIGAASDCVDCICEIIGMIGGDTSGCDNQ